MCGEMARRAERFRRAAAREQERRPLQLVERLNDERGWRVERSTEQRLGRAHLAERLTRGRQDVEIVGMMPVIFDRRLRRPLRIGFQLVRAPKLGDRLRGSSGATQIVAGHVMRVRHTRRQARIRLRVRQGFRHPPGVLERVRQVVVSRSMVRRPREHPLVEGHRRRRAALTAFCRIGRLRHPAEQQELRVRRKRGERLVQCTAVGRQFRGVGRRDFCRESQRTDLDVPPVVRRCLGGASFRGFD